MKLLNTVLGEADKVHLHRVLNETLTTDRAGVEDMSKVPEFIARWTFIGEESIEAFHALKQSRRERLLSELVWRVTCYLDGSVTDVVGVDAYDLGRGFVAVKAEQDGQDILCLNRAEA